MTDRTRQTHPLILSVLLIIGLFCASSVWASPTTSQGFDANGDGQVTFEEVMKKEENWFDDLLKPFMQEGEPETLML